MHQRKVVNQSYCACYQNDFEVTEVHCLWQKYLINEQEMMFCKCGEKDDSPEWFWDNVNHTKLAVTLSNNNKEAFFHNTFSPGTAVVRGNQPFQQNCHYYWEIKILTKLYGTDVMIGVGTERLNMDTWLYRFCSLLGMDEHSWGYSYSGNIHHDGEHHVYGPGFSKGSLVGCHLDMYNGTVEYYHNRQPLGVAFTGLKPYANRLYPMICSTAARLAMRIACAVSMKSSLQMSALRILSQFNYEQIKGTLNTVPGLRKMLSKKFWWMIERPLEMSEFFYIAQESQFIICSSDEGSDSGNHLEKKNQYKKRRYTSHKNDSAKNMVTAPSNYDTSVSTLHSNSSTDDVVQQTAPERNDSKIVNDEASPSNTKDSEETEPLFLCNPIREELFILSESSSSNSSSSIQSNSCEQVLRSTLRKCK